MNFALRSFTFFRSCVRNERDCKFLIAAIVQSDLNLHFFRSIKRLIHLKSALNEFIEISINRNTRVRIDT